MFFQINGFSASSAPTNLKCSSDLDIYSFSQISPEKKQRSFISLDGASLEVLLYLMRCSLINKKKILVINEIENIHTDSVMKDIQNTSHFCNQEDKGYFILAQPTKNKLLELCPQSKVNLEPSFQELVRMVHDLLD